MRMTGTPEQPSTLVNLSAITLNEEQHLLLRGLFFCPTPHQIDKKPILDDLESYYKLINNRCESIGG